MAPLRELIESGQVAIGTLAMMPCAFSAEILADVGYDFLLIDCQHGLIGYDAMVPMLQASSRRNTTTIVRVPPDDAARIGMTLDAGAAGVVVPLVSSLEDAERAVAATRYPPRGQRSMGPVRSSMFYAGTPAEVNEQVLCILLVESETGARAATEICACSGVDAVMIGYTDLALSMGIAPHTDSREVEAAAALIVDACRAHGVPTMVVAASPQQIEQRIAEGHQLLLVGADYGFLRSGATGSVAMARTTIAATTAALAR